ncbi:MAG: hypothetical protein ABIQ10_08540, partial [Gemmatimonadaceae bacterium]
MNPFIISFAIKLTILLMAGGLAAILVRRSTYAMRHAVIAATLLCVVALPATMLAVPEWRVGVLPAASPVSRTFTIVATPVRAIVSSATETKINAAAPSTSESMHPVLMTSLVEPSLSAASVIATRPSLAASVLASLRTTTPSQLLLAIWLAGVALGLAWIALGRYGLARVRRRATPLATYEWR